jgi:cytochrome c oxidase cbb3-type subunit 3
LTVSCFLIFTGGGYYFAGQFDAEMPAAGEEIPLEHVVDPAPALDETTVSALTDEQSLSIGQSIFNSNCAVCHGRQGEGLAGPNLTDEYWLHGGGIGDIFKTIKEGVPEKGMIRWEKQLSPQNIQQVASYILSLSGANPPNAKGPEGVKQP